MMQSRQELLADGAVVGAQVRVVTGSDEVFEGSVFTLDPVSNFLILGACSCVK